MAGHWSIIPEVTVRAGGNVSDRAARFRSYREGFLGGDFRRDRIDANLHLKLIDFDQRSSDDLVIRRKVQGPQTRFLTEGHAWMGITGPIGVRAGWAQGLVVTDDTRTAVTAEAGPSLRMSRGWIDLTLFTTWFGDGGSITPGTSAIRHHRAAGLELRGAWKIMRNVRTSVAVAWAEEFDPQGGVLRVDIPSVRGLASVRYDFNVEQAFLEAHVRGTSAPLHIWSNRPGIYAPGLEPEAFLRAGVMGAMDLAKGLRLNLVIENVFDTPYRLHNSATAGSGVDLRVALSYMTP